MASGVADGERVAVAARVARRGDRTALRGEVPGGRPVELRAGGRERVLPGQADARLVELPGVEDGAVGCFEAAAEEPGAVDVEAGEAEDVGGVGLDVGLAVIDLIHELLAAGALEDVHNAVELVALVVVVVAEEVEIDVVLLEEGDEVGADAGAAVGDAELADVGAEVAVDDLPGLGGGGEVGGEPVVLRGAGGVAGVPAIEGDEVHGALVERIVELGAGAGGREGPAGEVFRRVDEVGVGDLVVELVVPEARVHADLLDEAGGGREEMRLPVVGDIVLAAAGQIAERDAEAVGGLGQHGVVSGGGVGGLAARVADEGERDGRGVGRRGRAERGVRGQGRALVPHAVVIRRVRSKTRDLDLVANQRIGRIRDLAVAIRESPFDLTRGGAVNPPHDVDRSGRLQLQKGAAGDRHREARNRQQHGDREQPSEAIVDQHLDCLVP